jgi:hypothetical protein
MEFLSQADGDETKRKCHSRWGRVQARPNRALLVSLTLPVGLINAGSGGDHVLLPAAKPLGYDICTRIRGYTILRPDLSFMFFSFKAL